MPLLFLRGQGLCPATAPIPGARGGGEGGCSRCVPPPVPLASLGGSDQPLVAGNNSHPLPPASPGALGLGCDPKLSRLPSSSGCWRVLADPISVCVCPYICVYASFYVYMQIPEVSAPFLGFPWGAEPDLLCHHITLWGCGAGGAAPTPCPCCYTLGLIPKQHGLGDRGDRDTCGEAQLGQRDGEGRR